jgi:hypothetical protein
MCPASREDAEANRNYVTKTPTPKGKPMFKQDDVKRLVDEFGAIKLDPGVETEISQFGLSAHLFDPVSGQIITLARPHRADIGQSEIMLTAAQAAGAVASARTKHLHDVRAMGFASIEHFNDAQNRNAASRDLAAQQAAERAKLDEQHAEATAAAAAAAGPNKEAVADAQAQDAQAKEDTRLREERRQRELANAV